MKIMVVAVKLLTSPAHCRGNYMKAVTNKQASA
jgi:hypothetical protein